LYAPKKPEFECCSVAVKLRADAVAAIKAKTQNPDVAMAGDGSQLKPPPGCKEYLCNSSQTGFILKLHQALNNPLCGCQAKLSFAGRAAAAYFSF
jgi:hypothetical protein